MSSILRKRLSSGWTGVPNTTIRDRSISHRATGVLVFLLSMDDGWSMDARVIAERKGHERRDAVLTALRELRDAGYMRHTKTRDGGRFVTEVEVSDVPLDEWKGGHVVDLTTRVGFPGPGKPAPGQPGPGAPDPGSSDRQESTRGQTPKGTQKTSSSCARHELGHVQADDDEDPRVSAAIRSCAESALEEVTIDRGPRERPAAWLAAVIDDYRDRGFAEAMRDYLDDDPDADVRDLVVHVHSLRELGELAEVEEA